MEKGEVPVARLNDMVHRILRTEIRPGRHSTIRPVLRPVNPFTGAEVAQRVAERGIVLLKNANGQLPLEASGIKSIAVIGEHADAGVLSGSGSDQVNPAGGNAVPGQPRYRWHPSSPLKAITRQLARTPEWFMTPEPTPQPQRSWPPRPRSPSSSSINIPGRPRRARTSPCPHNQDELISQVAAANPHCIVVLETGGP